MKKIYLSLTTIFFFLTVFTLYQFIFEKNLYYQEKYQEKTTTTVFSLSTPRGRILDCNGNVLVDNIGVKAIVYRKVNNITSDEEIEIAYKLSEMISFSERAKENQLKNFWMLLYPEEAKKLITEEELELYDKRKLTSHDLYLLRMERVTDLLLDSLTERDKLAAYVYSLMNDGYKHDAKLIKIEVSEEEYARVLEAKIPGVTNEMYFKRYYPYENTLKSILGSIGSIPEEEKDVYLEKGYSLDDLVGVSYLEKEYEDYLRGEKDTYLVNSDGTLTLLKSGKKGNDIVLSIDINMQIGIENILKEEIIKGKKLLNTEYYNGSYVLVGDTNNGSIKAIAGLKYVNDDILKNVEADVVNSSFTVGSIVKGASMAMAYQNGLVDVGKKIKDSCVKLYLVPKKCSYKSLGYIDDITALKTSSNYYQFLLAIKLAGYKYSYNMKMQVTNREFDIYRNTFASFGLGVKTEIDLPNETTGIKGSKIAPDLLLNFSIGQYDTYTPLQLLQYINTIASNGVRYKLNLMDHIIDSDGNVLVTNEKEILNTYELDSTYFERIKTGFYQVVNLGTGYGYADTKYKAAGKTGTSEAYYDSDKDGVGDILTITNTFAMYAPFDNPKYSMVVVSPNVSHYSGSTDYFAYINRYISKSVSSFIYEE